MTYFIYEPSAQQRAAGAVVRTLTHAPVLQSSAELPPVIVAKKPSRWKRFLTEPVRPVGAADRMWMAATLGWHEPGNPH